MKPIETGKLLNFADFRSHSDTYVETGSCYGQSIDRALGAGFPIVKSCEVYEPFYRHCKSIYKEQPKVTLFLGNSKDSLPLMLEGITEPCVIFLDAHPAGEGTGGHDDLMKKGNKSEFQQDFILTKEIDIILNHGKNHVIIIDDQNGENNDNKAYIKTLLKANPSYLFYFYDEQLGDAKSFYKNKSLVCIPDGK